MLSQYFSLPYFLISLAIGLFYVYISVPAPTLIYVYPTPDNIHTIEYKDKADSCFKFTAVETPCLDNAKTIPVQK